MLYCSEPVTSLLSVESLWTSRRTWLSMLLPEESLAKMADCISFSRCLTITSQAFHSRITCWYRSPIFASIFTQGFTNFRANSKNVCVCVCARALYLTHLLFAHAKLVVSQKERPHLLSDFVLHSTVINQPEQLQLLVVLHTHTQYQEGRQKRGNIIDKKRPERKRKCINNGRSERVMELRTGVDVD